MHHDAARGARDHPLGRTTSMRRVRYWTDSMVRSRGSMAERRCGAAPQYRRHPSPTQGELPASRLAYTPRQTGVQASRRDPVLDRGRTESEAEELAARNHAVLLGATASRPWRAFADWAAIAYQRLQDAVSPPIDHQVPVRAHPQRAVAAQEVEHLLARDGASPSGEQPVVAAPRARCTVSSTTSPTSDRVATISVAICCSSHRARIERFAQGRQRRRTRTAARAGEAG